MTQYTYVNGRFVAAHNASVSVQDRGFRYGDGLFETVAVYRGVPYQWELHMQRLAAGARVLGFPLDTDSLLSVAQRLLARNKLKDAGLRIAVSRGVGSIGYLPVGAADATVVMESAARITPPADPASLWLSDYEKPSPRALPVQFKLAQGLNSTLVRMEAAQHGCLDAIQLNAAGHITETSSGNIFWRVGDTLYTPSLECGLLAGTTRAAILRLSPYRVKEGFFDLSVLQNADALVVTNTNWQAMPVTEIKQGGWCFLHSVALARELRAVLQKDIDAYVASRTS